MSVSCVRVFVCTGVQMAHGSSRQVGRKLYAPMLPVLQHSLGKTYECHGRPPAPNPRDTGAVLIEEIKKEDQ